MTKTQLAQQENISAIRRALKALNSLAFHHRWGAMYKEWEIAKAALEALEEVEMELEDRQMELLEIE